MHLRAVRLGQQHYWHQMSARSLRAPSQIALRAVLCSQSARKPTLGFTEGWSKENIPCPFDPSTSAACGSHIPPGGWSYLCDPDNLLSPAAALKVQEQLLRFPEEVKIGGIQDLWKPPLRLTVVIVNKIRFAAVFRTPREEGLEIVRALHRQWGLGERGLLLLMVASDKDMVLCTGMGLAASDIDGMWSLVQDFARPPLGEGKVEAAVTRGVLGFRMFTEPEFVKPWEEERRGVVQGKLDSIAEWRDQMLRAAESGEALPEPDSCPSCLGAFAQEERGQGGGAHGRLGADGEHAMHLLCGHAFCARCFQTSGCPICFNLPVTATSSFNDPASQRALGRDRAVAETTYRLRTVQKQHPDYIQDDNVEMWSRPYYRGRFATPERRPQAWIVFRANEATHEVGSGPGGQSQGKERSAGDW